MRVGGGRFPMWRVCRVGSHDPFFYPVTFRSLFQLMETFASTISSSNKKLDHVNRSLDRQIGMEPLVIDWAKDEAKMAKIVRNFHL